MRALAVGLVMFAMGLGYDMYTQRQAREARAEAAIEAARDTSRNCLRDGAWSSNCGH